MPSIAIEDRGLTVAGPAEITPPHTYAYVSGHQYAAGKAVRRFVSLSLHTASSTYREALYAGAYLSPEDARNLAGLLLDAADEADAGLDSPVEYVPTGKQ